MNVAIALCDFSADIMNQTNQAQNQNSTEDSLKTKDSQNETTVTDQENLNIQNDKVDDQKSPSAKSSDGQNQIEVIKEQEEKQENIQQSHEDETKIETTQGEESNQEKTIQENQNNSNISQQTQNDSQQQQNQMQYLSFKKDDRIVVKYQYENGWWWGCLLGIRNPIDGYFPSTYVKLSHKIGDDFDDQQQDEKDIEGMGWEEYANYVKKQAQIEDIDEQYDKYINDTVERRENNLERFLNPGIKGYKKVKIDPSQQDSYKNIKGSFFSKEGDTVFIPVKSQDPLDKACRQLNHYFDYDQWNEQMNRSKQNKAHANPNRKKEKNENKFLQKLK